MQIFHTIVIGAGPAGLTCGRVLAEHGIEVLVLERKPRVGPKVCGGGITWQGLLRHVPEELIERAFPVQHIRTPRQRVRITSATPIIATVERSRLGAWMEQQARAAGAMIRTATMVKEVTSHHVTVASRDGGKVERLGFRYLVGADGSNSMVRRYLRLPTRGMGIGIHYRLPGEFPQMEWHLHPRLFGNGYAWIFPYNGYASIGIFAGGSMPTRAMQSGLHQWMAQKGIAYQGARPRAGLINYDFRGWRFGNLLLAGDAAGLASGLTGEGMYPALVSGEAVARAVIDPLYTAHALERLIRQQHRHRRVMELCGKNRFLCTAVMEMMTVGLRTGMIPFSALEMAD